MTWRALLLVVLLVTGCGGPSAPVTAPAGTTGPPSPTSAPTTAPTSTASRSVAPTPTVTSPRGTPTRTRTRAPSSRPSTTATAKARSWKVSRVTAADLPHSWRSGCPVGPADLRKVTVPYWGFDGVTHRGPLVVRAAVADDIGRTFARLHAQRFAIRSIRLVDDFGGSDDRSMAADNTSGFNCRRVEGSSSWSQHAYGLAVDINPRENPYVQGDEVDPPEGKPYVGRTPTRKGMISAGGHVVRAFSSIGWSWGGYWRSSKDYQHFSSSGR